MIRVKICGITNLGDAFMAAGFGADALGFVFAQSLRKIGSKEAGDICEKLPPFISKVGVFVDEEAGVVWRIARECGLDALQFHGRENPVYCKAFKRSYKVIKGFRVGEGFDPAAILAYDVDGFLLDSEAHGSLGGSGLTFDWRVAQEVRGKTATPLILSGGLNPDNIVAAIETVDPFGVDVSSGTEERPGKKDREKVERFILRAKSVSLKRDFND